MALSTRKFGSQTIEPITPELQGALQPSVGVPQWRGIDAVEPPSAFRSHGGESVLPQHPQVLRHGRLRNTEFFSDDRRDIASGMLPISQQLENPPPYRISQNIKRVHGAKLRHQLI